MTATFFNTIIIGGGHAGVVVACNIALENADVSKKTTSEGDERPRHRERSYLVLEKAGTLFPQWRSRFAGFKMNTPHSFSLLPFQEPHLNPDSLGHEMAEDIKGWDEHVAKLNIKHQLNVTVNKVERIPAAAAAADSEKDDGARFLISATQSDGTELKFRAVNVCVCSGKYGTCTVPQCCSGCDFKKAGVKTHTPQGFSWSDLTPDGNVLVVGGCQSGVQIADLLADGAAGGKPKKVFLCSSKAKGSPRSYRGVDIFPLMRAHGMFYLPKQALAGFPPEQAESMRYGSNPITGPDRDISLFSLHRKNVQILGRLTGCSDKSSGDTAGAGADAGAAGAGGLVLNIGTDRCENAKLSLHTYEMFLGFMKEGAEKLEQQTGAKLPQPTPNKEWEPVDELLNEVGPSELEIGANSASGITDVIFATGYSFDLSFLEEGLGDVMASEDFDQRTKAPDVVVSSRADGLFFLGFPWLTTIMSQNITHMDADAKTILKHLK